ncbi:hypothetical protein A1D22_02785 [Pasteurellaceae bacterium LFhippo2]|nr:hypothetical protein [Pasteurellaceae bacterium LFhippo2]
MKAIIKKFHISAIQQWDHFVYEDKLFDMSHLNAHELVVDSNKGSYCLVVTYGLHCFTKNDTEYSLPIYFSDSSQEIRAVELERYYASKELRAILEENITHLTFYQTDQKRFFTLYRLNNLTGKIEPYKICITLFKENRLLRLHILSAYFVREGYGAENNPVPKTLKHFSVFKLLLDLVKKDKASSVGVKEAFR